MYYSADGSVEYGYIKDSKYYGCAKIAGQASWTIEEIEETEYNNFYAFLIPLAGYFSEFVYNSDLKAYESDLEESDVKVFFEDGKVTKITMAEIGDVVNVVCTFEYENVVLTLPVEE